MIHTPKEILEHVRAEFECLLDSDLDWLADEGCFTQNGIDSVMVISVAAALRRRFGEELPDDVVFSKSASIASFARYYTSVGRRSAAARNDNSRRAKQS
jgi:acyl carrier protein